MSQISLASNAGGTGIFTIASPNSSTNRTLNLPNSAGTIATAESTLAQFNASGSAPVYACRAWVNFNGEGTVAIRASGNVSSITDHGVGDYTLNFTTAMPDTNYAASGMIARISSDSFFNVILQNNSRTKTTLACPVITKVSNGTLEDNANNSVAIFR